MVLLARILSSVPAGVGLLPPVEAQPVRSTTVARVSARRGSRLTCVSSWLLDHSLEGAHLLLKVAELLGLLEERSFVERRRQGAESGDLRDRTAPRRASRAASRTRAQRSVASSWRTSLMLRLSVRPDPSAIRHRSHWCQPVRRTPAMGPRSNYRALARSATRGPAPSDHSSLEDFSCGRSSRARSRPLSPWLRPRACSWPAHVLWRPKPRRPRRPRPRHPPPNPPRANRLTPSPAWSSPR